MAGLQIFELDSNSEPVSVLQIGEYIFGRGPLLKCDDRRVSRKHGVITITDQTATITSTHQNPCFYQAASSTTITILPKDNPVAINDGDKFALLADQFWFRIKLTKNGSGNSLKPNTNFSSQIENLSSNHVEGGRHSPRLSPLPFTTAPVSNKTDDVQDDSITQKSTDKPLENIPEPSNNVDGDDSSDSIDFLQSAQKRPHEVDVESPSSTKKTKLNNGDEDEENELLSVLSDLKNDSVCESKDENKKEVELEDEDNNKETTVETKKEVMSDTDDEDNVTVKVKPDTPKKNPYKWKKEKASKENKASVSSAQSAHDLELKAMLFSSDEENENQTNDLNTEAKTGSNSKTIQVNKDFKLNINDDSPVVKKDDDKKQKKDSKDKETDKNDDEDPNVAGTSGANAKKQHRDRCWYELKCYRKSASHLAEYSHPGDSDFASDPEDDRPVCAFGAGCYRRNKDHRQEYKHPSKPQKPPGGGKKQKKKTDNAGGTLPSKRTKRKKYNESSEDDYDLQDPFLDDSGTEYEATSSDGDDSDSDWSGASEEGTKRLLKEAKKFTGGKKKDED